MSVEATRTPAAATQKGPQGSKEAIRTTALILEALGGLRSAPEAADTLGISLARYYVLERRAIQGMVAALEPRKRGRQRPLKAEIERLSREVERLEQDLLRYQALHRASQRVIGVPREDAPQTGRRKKAAKTTRVRRKKSRAEKVLVHLGADRAKKDAPPDPAVSDASSDTSQEV